MKQHILVVDDEVQIRELLAIYLTRLGYRVSTAASCAETWHKVDQDSVDLVVLDIGLAEEDGLKLLPELKAKHPKVRVVILTGMGFVEDLLQEALQRGADGYVSKVLPLDELHMTIQRTLNPERPELDYCQCGHH